MKAFNKDRRERIKTIKDLIEAKKAGKKIIEHGEIIHQTGPDQFMTKEGKKTRSELDEYLDGFFVVDPCPFVIITPRVKK